MHIIIEDQTSGERTILCIERDAQHAEIIRMDNWEHLGQMEAIAKAVGAEKILLRTLLDAGEHGWEKLLTPTWIKQLNQKPR